MLVSPKPSNGARPKPSTNKKPGTRLQATRPHYKLKAQAKHTKEKPHGIPTCNVQKPHGFTQEGASRPHTHVDQVYWTPTPQGGPRLGPASGWLNTQEKPHGIPTYNVRMPHGFTQEGASRPHTYVDQDHGHLPPKVDPGLAQLTPG